MTARDSDHARRQAFRDFARLHHPDRGGDPATFSAGLAEFGRGAAAGGSAGGHGWAATRSASVDTPLVFYRRTRGLAAPLAWVRAQLAERARRTRAPRVR